MDGAANDNTHAGGPSMVRRSCPICGKPAVAEVRPFCSKRCADVDLHRWFGGAYGVPAQPDEAGNDATVDD